MKTMKYYFLCVTVFSVLGFFRGGFTLPVHSVSYLSFCQAFWRANLERFNFPFVLSPPIWDLGSADVWNFYIPLCD